MSKRIAWRNFTDTVISFLRNDDTTPRVRTVADRDGRLLDDTDLSTLTTVSNSAKFITAQYIQQNYI